MNSFLNQERFGNQDVNFFQISSNTHEVSSLVKSCSTLTCSYVSFRSVVILLLCSMEEQLSLITEQTPPCEANEMSRAIRYCKTTVDKLDNSSCTAWIVFIVLFSIFSIVADIFTTVFSKRTEKVIQASCPGP